MVKQTDEYTDNFEVVGWAHPFTHKVYCMSCAAKRLWGQTSRELLPIYEDFSPDDPALEVICTFCRKVVVHSLDEITKR